MFVLLDPACANSFGPVPACRCRVDVIFTREGMALPIRDVLPTDKQFDINLNVIFIQDTDSK